MHIINRKGMEPLNISSIVTSSPMVLFITNITIPKGGVSNPISTVMVVITPNHIGSKPKLLMTGITTGRVRIIMEMESIKAPRMNRRQISG